MLLFRLDRRLAILIRVVGLVAIDYSVLGNRHHAGTSGRGLLITGLLVATNIAWVAWTIWPDRGDRITLDLWVLALAGAVLLGAAPNSAASAFVFVAAAAAALRVELDRALVLVALAALILGVATLIYEDSALGLLAYTLGFAATALAGSNSRQSVQRAEQAELLVAQTQRSQEEHVRAARLEESTRIAREIHDVLAHALAGLAIQLEATSALLEQGADRGVILARVQRAHELAREGLQETRRAVGALRGHGPSASSAVEAVSARAAIEALVEEYRATADAPVQLTIDGDSARLRGPTGQAVVRVVQEALTNVSKHAPGAGVSVSLHAGERPDEEVVVCVDDRPIENGNAAPRPLATTGGGYGVQGMRERAQLLGGTLSAGAGPDGWHVELRLPAPPDFSGPGQELAPAAADETAP
jgi:signal transduction histidine kinase